MSGNKRPQIPPDLVDSLQQITLWDYIISTGAEGWKKVGKNYFNIEHDSLCASPNGKWHWQSRGTGGYSAFSYLMIVKGMDYYGAMMTLKGAGAVPAISPQPVSEKSTASFALPPAHEDNKAVIDYLVGRGIARRIVHECILAGYLYQSRDTVAKNGASMTFFNATFVGYSRSGIPRFAHQRGTGNARFALDVAGSDKAYSFSLPALDPGATVLIRTEGAVDVLSLATLAYETNSESWRRVHYLAGGLTHQPLERYLSEYPEISHIIFAYDRDAAGQRMMRKHMKAYEEKGYSVTDSTPPLGDWNEYLQHLQRERRSRGIPDFLHESLGKESKIVHHKRDPTR